MIVFIIPYRDRYYHKVHFNKYMEYILEDYDKDNYRFLFIHQQDNLPFNRGAMKNIGFLYVKKNYTNYKDITLVFHDIDTIPAEKNLFHYGTRKGIVKHFYGFTYALGGIVSITAGDFENINGFPNYWHWGYEDNILNVRVNKNKNMIIDRSIFFPIGSMEILHEIDTLKKYFKKKKQTNLDNHMEMDGFNNISNIEWNFDPNNNFLNIKKYICKKKYNPQEIKLNSIFNANNNTQTYNRFKMRPL